MVEAPERIWIDSKGVYPYFYPRKPSDYGFTTAEYVRADKLGKLAPALADRDKEIAALRKALDDAADALDQALEDVEHWGAYAGEYFQDKHDLDGGLARISEQATAARRALEGDTNE